VGRRLTACVETVLGISADQLLANLGGSSRLSGISPPLYTARRSLEGTKSEVTSE